MVDGARRCGLWVAQRKPEEAIADRKGEIPKRHIDAIRLIIRANQAFGHSDARPVVGLQDGH